MATLAALLLVASIPREEPGALVPTGNLEGIWVQTSGQINGSALPSRGHTWVFKDGKVILQIDGRIGATYQYKVNAATTPAAIDLVPGYKGIFATEGNTLKICLSASKKRPVAFDGNGPDHQYYTFKLASR